MDKALMITGANIFLPEQVGDMQELFTEIFDRYYKRIFNYIYYRLGNSDDAEELASQVFEQVIRKMYSYSSQRGSIEVWLFTIARNVVNDHYRQKKRRPVVSLDPSLDVLSAKPGPEETVINDETRTHLLAALGSLPQRERNIIAMKFAGGLKNREIAKLTGLSESNVGVIVYRSLKSLRDILER